MSQGDNWFIFHLLSSGDLRALKGANAHFSDDLLSSLLNEPLPGNGIFWSSVAGKTDQAGNAYPIPLRVLSFEQAYDMREKDGEVGASQTTPQHWPQAIPSVSAAPAPPLGAQRLMSQAALT